MPKKSKAIKIEVETPETKSVTETKIEASPKKSSDMEIMIEKAVRKAIRKKERKERIENKTLAAVRRDIVMPILKANDLTYKSKNYLPILNNATRAIYFDYCL